MRNLPPEPAPGSSLRRSKGGGYYWVTQTQQRWAELCIVIVLLNVERWLTGSWYIAFAIVAAIMIWSYVYGALAVRRQRKAESTKSLGRPQFP